MKFSYTIILLLCSLFLINGCKSSKKIQKNSEFKAICEEGEGSLTCEKGNSACGTEPGSGTVSAYCIDKNDIILTKAKCKVKGEDISFPVQCITEAEQRWREEEKRPRIVEKNVEFTVVCRDGRLRCKEGGTPACGVRSGEVTMQSYCIDVNDKYLGRVECLGASIPPVCERIIE